MAEQRTETLRVRMTPEELARLRSLSEGAGCTASEYIRAIQSMLSMQRAGRSTDSILWWTIWSIRPVWSSGGCGTGRRRKGAEEGRSEGRVSPHVLAGTASRTLWAVRALAGRLLIGCPDAAIRASRAVILVEN